jgi:DNA-binding XRE family transcriptional regulator
MLAVVKKPRIEISLSGSESAVSEVLEFLRSRYSISVFEDDRTADEETSVNAFETDFWWQTTPGALLRGYRLKHGFTQEQLARKSGIGQTVLSAYENGRRPLSQRAAIKIGEALGENPEKFFRHVK